MAVNDERKELIRKIAEELSFEEAVEILNIAIEKDDDIEKYSCMRMGEDGKLFTLVVADCDKDDEIHEALGDVIKEMFNVDEDDFYANMETLLNSEERCINCCHFDQRSRTCAIHGKNFIDDPATGVCNDYGEV